MKYLVSILLIFYMLGLAAQATDFLIGKWQVVQSLSPKGAPPKMEKELNKLKEIYEGANFEFLPDNKFNLIAKDPQNNIQEAYWVYNSATKSIKVCKWENRGQLKPLLLELSARTEKDGNTYFWFDVVPVALKVKKL
ncbi:hypothetical protein [Adhaeribacter rhizoryzae]|uniref:Lipocalin-like domain-containing protein n=1 Tax=Adhaeribacter rhizoryzae TaxID=2607907 RepID=A0A5M6DJX5_9BACT|nr:hypothetical protein [Adhaeribacter rhizoryzae]KAA5547801.1 hypothetical protein F0145_07595 [Adhaeribacter rhizoryzae]